MHISRFNRASIQAYLHTKMSASSKPESGLDWVFTYLQVHAHALVLYLGEFCA